jgi:hypothetical protein
MKPPSTLAQPSGSSGRWAGVRLSRSFQWENATLLTATIWTDTRKAKKRVSRKNKGTGVTITEFATRYRLKMTKDDRGDPVIPGRIGTSNIYEYAHDALGVVFVGAEPPRTNLWNKFKAACLAAGMSLRQSGDAEGAFTFDPNNREQAKVAIRGIRARAKRQVSPEQAAAGAARLLAARNSGQKPQQEALS